MNIYHIFIFETQIFNNVLVLKHKTVGIWLCA